ncbi:S1C family serine protease [Alienimonas chondri]|uniref:S1C family serine protease n=1 Tax=Alienimonas chondri TaxID=2681879 RepID=UPI0014884BCB|nr:trypsin-like peptidase domain-containing protein [Alienimonas chondri]
MRVGGGAAAPPQSSAAPTRAGGKRKAAPATKAAGPSTGVLIGGGIAAVLVVGGGMLGLGMMLAGGGDAAVAGGVAPTPVVAETSPTEPRNAAGDSSNETSSESAPDADRSERAPSPAEDDETGVMAKGGLVADLGIAKRGGLSAEMSSDAEGAEAVVAPADSSDAEGSEAAGPVATASSEGLPAVRGEELRGSELVSAVMPSVVRINNTGPRARSQGSGYLVHSDGIVVTNYHVVSGANRIEVEFQDGKKYDSPGYLLVEPQYDIAVIKIDLEGDDTRPAVPLMGEFPAQGSEVMAFGTPQGLNFSSTRGSVNAVRDEDEIRNKTNTDHRGTWIQFDASISSGNSGGPLCDMRGNVVGMNTFVMGGGGVAQNLNFAISSVDIREKVRGVLDAYQGESSIQRWSAEKLKEFDGDLGRKLVENEIGTNKGKRILASMTEVLFVKYQEGGDPSLDGVRRYVDSQAEKAVEKSNMSVVWKRPERIDIAIMVIKMDVEPKERGSSVMVVTLEAEVVVPDTEDDSKQNLFCRVWTHKGEIGTLSPMSIVTGKVPPGWSLRLMQFFGDFRRVYKDAQDEALEGNLDDDTERDGSKIAEEGEGLFEELFGGIFNLPEPGADVGEGEESPRGLGPEGESPNEGSRGEFPRPMEPDDDR